MAESFRITKNLVQNNIPWEECEQSDKTPQVVAWYVKIGLEGLLLLANVAAEVAEAIHEGSKVVCQQDAAGANVSITCAGNVAYWLIFKGAADLLEAGIAGADLTIEHGNYFNVDDAFNCINLVRQTQKEMLEKVQENNLLIRDINKKTGDAASGIIELKKLVMENRAYIKDNRNVLLTPHGRRDDLTQYEAPPPPPKIVSVKGQTNSATLVVTFNEGVWTDTEQSGQLMTGDFTLTNNASSDSESIMAVTHVAGAATATLILDNPLDGDEFGFNTLAGKANAIFNQFGITMDDSIDYYLE